MKPQSKYQQMDISSVILQYINIPMGFFSRFFIKIPREFCADLEKARLNFKVVFVWVSFSFHITLTLFKFLILVCLGDNIMIYRVKLLV